MIHYEKSIICVAEAAHEILRAFQFTMADENDTVSPVELLPDDVREILLYDTFCILEHPEKTPEEWHTIRLEEDKKRGWKWGYFYKPELMEDPLCGEWMECPASYRAAKTMFWSAVVAMGLSFGYVSREADEAYHLAMGEEAAKEAMDAITVAITNQEA
jgi:hypothetical protein